MKKVFLYCLLTVFSLFLLGGTAMAASDAPLAVNGECGNAYLFSIGEATYLVGAADQTSSLAQLADVHVDHVVLICDHADHVAATETAAEALAASVIRPTEVHEGLEWQDGALLIGGYAFAVNEPVDGYMTMDCQGNYLTFQASTNTSSVNVRATPTTKGKRVEKLSKGAVVTVVGQEENDSGELWYRVVLENGEEGFVRSDLLNTGAATAATATPKPSGSGMDDRYVGNKNSKVFHRPDCESLPKGKNAVYFSSRSYAIAKGYRPCEHCDP